MGRLGSCAKLQSYPVFPASAALAPERAPRADAAALREPPQRAPIGAPAEEIETPARRYLTTSVTVTSLLRSVVVFSTALYLNVTLPVKLFGGV